MAPSFANDNSKNALLLLQKNIFIGTILYRFTEPRIILNKKSFINYIFKTNLKIPAQSESLSVYLSFSTSVCPAIHLSVHLSSCPYICLSVNLSVNLSIYLAICLSVHPSVFLSIHLSVHSSVCPFICTFGRLSVHPSAYMSIHLSVRSSQRNPILNSFSRANLETI